MFQIISDFLPVFSLSVPSALVDILSILVGGGTQVHVLVKSLLWILIFAILFNKGTTKVFHESKKIAVIIAIVLSTLAMYFAPDSLIDTIINYLSVILPVSLILIVYWLVWWFIKSPRKRALILSVTFAIIIWGLHTQLHNFPQVYFFLDTKEAFVNTMTIVLGLFSIGFFIKALKKTDAQIDRKDERDRIRAETKKNLNEARK